MKPREGPPRASGLPGAALLGLLALAPLPALAAPQDSFTLEMRPQDIYPPAAVTDLTGTAGAEGQALLQWTSPEESGGLIPKGEGPSSYDMRFATFSASELGRGATSWFEAARPLEPPAPLAAGRMQSLLTGLEPGVTYYFGLRSKDDAGLDSVLDEKLEGVLAQARVPVKGIAFVRDLAAAAGSASGSVDLNWTAPRRVAVLEPLRYEIRVSSAGQIADNAQFESARPLTAFSPSSPPPVGAPGQAQSLTLTGLVPGTTYYFALRAEDAGSPPLKGGWLRSVLLGLNPANFARAKFLSSQIPPILDLSASSGAEAGDVRLAWTQPDASALVLPARYRVKVSTLGNIPDDAAFESAAELSAFSPSPAPPLGGAGGAVAFTVTGLSPLSTYYFAVRLEDSQPAAGAWSRAGGRNAGNFALPRFLPNAPDRVTDLAAFEGAAEGEVRLTWTAPRNQNYVPMQGYLVRYATFPAPGGEAGAESWFSLGAPSALGPASAPGSRESFILSGLHPASTFYFALKAADALGELSAVDATAPSSQALSKPKNLPPAVPSGLAASGRLNRAALSWSEPGPAGRGLDFSRFKLYRSTEPLAAFAFVGGTAALEYVDKPLRPFTTYYYRLSAEDEEGLESAPSAPVSVQAFTLPPLDPFGFRVESSSAEARIRWGAVRRFADGTPFDEPATPSSDELLGYQVLRATSPCIDFGVRALLGAEATGYADATGEDHYYYQVNAFNTLGFSSASVTLDSLGRQFILLDDCVSRMSLSAEAATELTKEKTGLQEDILLASRRRPEDTGDKVLQSVEFVPMLGGHTRLKDFRFEKPVPVSVHYVTEGGRPVPQTAAFSAREARGQGGRSALASGEARHLGLFWHNGEEFKKLYGKVDPVEQTVTAETPNPGLFQVRTLYREGGVTFDLSNITSRVFTPNGDGKNDVVLFLFDNPRHSPVEGRIYDLRGAEVAAMSAGPQPDSLMWDGRMNGKVVTGGVYIYQLKGEGKTFNGTIVVAR